MNEKSHVQFHRDNKNDLCVTFSLSPQENQTLSDVKLL